MAESKSVSKSVFGLWHNIKVSDLNRLLREHNVRLVRKTSREWGDQVVITAQPINGAPQLPVPGADDDRS